MTIRCVWSYLLCIVEGRDRTQSQQIVLAWFSFAGRSYRRDGILRDGAGKIEEALGNGEIQSEVVAWSLGYEPQSAFSFGFQGGFRTSPSSSGAFNINGGMPGQNFTSLEFYEDTLLARICSDSIEIAINGERRCGNGGREGIDSSDTTVVSGLSAFRWRSIDFKGRIEARGHSQDINGIAYFQQVRSHIPLLPWDWCYCVLPDGSISGISTLRIGRDLIPNEKHIRSDRISLFDLSIFSRGFFLDGRTGKLFRMTRSRVVNSIIEGEGCVKRILASDGNGCQITLDVKIEGAHTFKFSRAALPFFNLAFHYRSSIGSVQKFSFENQRNESFSRLFHTGICNLERTYGVMT